RRDQMRVAMSQGVDRDPGMEIQIGGAVLAEQSHALAPLEGEIGPGIGTVKRGHSSFLQRAGTGDGRGSRPGRMRRQARWPVWCPGVANAPQKSKTRSVLAARHGNSYAFAASWSQSHRPKPMI